MFHIVSTNFFENVFQLSQLVSFHRVTGKRFFTPFGDLQSAYLVVGIARVIKISRSLPLASSAAETTRDVLRAADASAPSTPDRTACATPGTSAPQLGKSPPLHARRFRSLRRRPAGTGSATRLRALGASGAGGLDRSRRGGGSRRWLLGLFLSNPPVTSAYSRDQRPVVPATSNVRRRLGRLPSTRQDPIRPRTERDTRDAKRRTQPLSRISRTRSPFAFASGWKASGP